MRKVSNAKLSLLSKTLVSSILICVLAIISAASAGLAWNAINKETEVGGTDVFQIESKAGVTIEDCKVYYVEDGAYKMQDVANLKDITMITYDTVFPERNVNPSIIIRLELRCIPKISAKINMKVTCPEKTEGTTWVDGNGHLTANLSNIVELNATCGLSGIDDLDPENSDNYKTIYDAAVGAMSSANKKQFATVSSDLMTNTDKVSSVEIDMTVTESMVTENNSIIAYVQYDYNKNLVQAFVNQNGIILPANYEDLEEGDPTIVDFPNDLKNIVFTPKD